MADTMISFADNRLSTSFLSKEELLEACPHAFRSEPTNPNVSDKYVQANTMTVIDDLAKLGWFPVQAKQCRAKKNSSGVRSFHMIALQNPNIKIMKTNADGTQVVDTYPRIIMTNSHDGYNSFKFMLGLFRLVCSNGLVVCDNQMVNMSIRHINYTFEELRRIVAQAIEEVPNIVNTMNKMKKFIILSLLMLAGAGAKADEGMWMVHNFEKNIYPQMVKKGFKLKSFYFIIYLLSDCRTFVVVSISSISYIIFTITIVHIDVVL